MNLRLTALAALACAVSTFAQDVAHSWAGGWNHNYPDKDYCVTNLEGEQRVFWLSADGMTAEQKRWRVLEGAAFRQNGDGTATMTGAIVNVANPDWRFSVVVEFSSYYSSWQTPPSGSPKIESPIVPLLQSNGGPIDPGTWSYYAQFEGTLTGQLGLAGAVLQITRRGPAFQIGVGANGKDATFGGSGWFDVQIVSQPTEGELPRGLVGDINGSFEKCECLGGIEALWENYGTGTPGCDGVRSLTMIGKPLTGSVPRISIGGASVGANSAMVWGIGAGATFVPLLGGPLLIQLPVVAAIPVFVPAEGYVFECSIPENPCEIGTNVYLQIVSIDPCGPAGFGMTRGLHMRIGDL
ncbi:MAG: hypothetical protein KDB80_17950 [Planctomycetes bacterium]|nr:hypothetical protein [Planctomycetota bacterium]